MSGILRSVLWLTSVKAKVLVLAASAALIPALVLGGLMLFQSAQLTGSLDRELGNQTNARLRCLPGSSRFPGCASARRVDCAVGWIQQAGCGIDRIAHCAW